MIKIVVRRFKKEGTTKLFLPEDVGWLDGMKNMTLPTIKDPKAHSYMSIVATHGTPSTESSHRQPMRLSGKRWLAEANPIPAAVDDGNVVYKNNHEGAMSLVKAMTRLFASATNRPGYSDH